MNETPDLPPSMQPITLSIEGGRITLSPDGINLKLWLSRQTVHIPWSNVQFVHPVPFVKRHEGQWYTYDGGLVSIETLGGPHEAAYAQSPFPGAESVRQSAFWKGKLFTMMAFEFALHDRHQPLNAHGRWSRILLVGGSWIKPLFRADDTPHPQQGVLGVHLGQSMSRRHGARVLAALDMIERYSSFGHLFHEGD